MDAWVDRCKDERLDVWVDRRRKGKGDEERKNAWINK